MNYLYGPVISRRLGTSLGVDILPLKTCSFDCIYCQLGATPAKTIERREYVAVEPVLDEVKQYLKSGGPEPDYITFSGSGEPTLNTGIGNLVREIKSLRGPKVAVLTNSSTISLPEVRESLCAADLVVPSLDAATQAAFEKVNRPYEGVMVEDIVDGLVAFRKEFEGEMRLEVLLVEGVNDSDSDLSAIKDAVRRIKPDSIDLNTVARPPAEDVRPLRPEKLKKISDYLGAHEVAVSGKKHTGVPGEAAKKIVDLLRRRPCSFAEVCSSLGLATDEAAAALAALSRKGYVRNLDGRKDGFYRAK